MLLGTMLLAALFFSLSAYAKGKKTVRTVNPDGKANILILCGHGEGDPGAVGCNGKYVEAAFNRDFGKRLYKELGKHKNLNVTLFDTNYNMFEHMKSATRSVGNFTGSGNKKNAILEAVKKDSVILTPTDYDYVLEVHFNATAESAKDPRGNGKKKGTGVYVNVHKSRSARKIDKKIIKALKGCKMNTWGKGIYRSSELLDARAYTEVGVNYTLLETCFIDDKDDMKFYLKKRNKMAASVAKAIAAYFK